MKFQAVIFDLDGTLLDTLRDLADTTNTALRQMNFPTHETHIYRYFVGDGRDLLAFRALPENRRDPKTVSELLRLINREYEERWREHSFPYPGIPELLDALTARKIRLAVLSNKAQQFTRAMVAHYLTGWRFDVVAGANPNVKNKPEPASALQIAGTLGISPSAIVFLGDTDIDMKTATAAGMYPVGALWGFRTPDELLANGAKSLITHPAELLKLF